MNSIQVFSNQDFSVRTYTDENGDVWFVAKDVCDMLGIANARDAVSELDDDEKNTVAITDGNRGNPWTNVINEPGLYKLTFKSRRAGLLMRYSRSYVKRAATLCRRRITCRLFSRINPANLHCLLRQLLLRPQRKLSPKSTSARKKKTLMQS